jgi:hypothetical protein
MVDFTHLVEALESVKPIRRRDGAIIVGISTILACIIVATLYGLRSDISAGILPQTVLLRQGTALLLGIAAFAAIARSTRPGVGSYSHGWIWVLAVAAFWPILSAFTWMTKGMPSEVLAWNSAPACLLTSLVSAVFIGSAMTLWAKRGAPTNLNQLGWLIGLASGSLGVFAYGLHCPTTGQHFVGIWYSLAVAISAAIGRLVIPPIVRW